MPVSAAGRVSLMVAALVGTVHAGFSVFWGLGGDWLLDTLGEQIVETFAPLRWVLVPVGLAKLAGAWVPVVLHARGWPAGRLWRPLCWLGAVALVAWGGLNTVVGNLVLAGVIDPGGGFDRRGMIGHAFLWDPLFLLWGLALGVGLRGTRAGRERRHAY